MKERKIEVRIRRAAILTFAGLAIQLATLLKIHPLAFVVFLCVGCPLMLAGTALYLTSLVSSEPLPETETRVAGAGEGSR
jgi:hypothetical protein